MARDLTPRELQRALKALPAIAREEAQRTMDVTAFQVHRGALRRVPVRTGRLKRAIAWKSRPRSLSSVVGIDDPQAFYWKFLEYRTSRTEPHRFFRPAAMELEGDHRQRMDQALERAGERLVRRV